MITLYRILKDQPDKDDEYEGEFNSATDVGKYLASKGISITKSAINKAVSVIQENEETDESILLKKGYIIKNEYLVFRFLD